MLSKIQDWFDSRFSHVLIELEALHAKLDRHPDLDATSKHLCREILKVKDFSNITKLELLSPSDRAKYVADASLAYTSYAFKDIIAEVQHDQMKFIVLTSDIGERGKSQELIARGTINGADLIEERMRALHLEHISNSSRPPDAQGLERHNSIGTFQ